jgi:hypothetical protein
MSISDWRVVELNKQDIIDGKAIADIWTIVDVLSCRQRSPAYLEGKLNEYDAKQILENVHRYMDTSVGINWNVIEHHIDLYIENRKEPTND